MNTIDNPIFYYALLGKRDKMQLTNVPQASVVNSMLRNLGCMPQSLEHFVYGCDYYEQIIMTKIGGGYHIVFVYSDTLEQFVEHLEEPSKGLNVFLICNEDECLLQLYQRYLPKIKGDRHIFLFPTAFQGKIDINPITYSKKEFFAFLYEFTRATLNVNESRLPYTVPIWTDFIDVGNSFTPSRVNTQTINSILGNWGYEGDYKEGDLFDIYMRDSKKAIAEKNTFNRQKILTDQILKIFNIELEVCRKCSPLPYFQDQFLPPLVMVIPFTSPEMYKIPKVNKKNDPLGLGSAFAKVLKFEYTPNYTVDVELKGAEILAIQILQNQIIAPRSFFFDIVGLLHSSFKFSPYIRLPYLGYSINNELSHVGPQQGLQLARSPKSNKLIRKRMVDIGKKMVEKAFAPDTIKMLKKRPSQIVAMSDLPVEWLDVDGIPLGFTHDICRLPETPIVSLLSQYVEAHSLPYAVPTDIISNTLVVFGNEDEAFVTAQLPVLELQKRLGFKIERCLNKKEFIKAIKKNKPEFLIMDCHGGVDQKTHESVLQLGKTDILRGQDIVENKIAVPLIFLSACETSTTYNTVSTIANAFFQVGARSVVTSYLPVYVFEASKTYCRLLNLLAEASTKPIHSNWLAFVSYVLRTSYINAPMGEGINNGINPSKEDLDYLTRLSVDSMFFKNRRRIFNELQNNLFTQKMKANYDTIIPHYLMYSILGRADMVRFVSHMHKEGKWLSTETDDEEK